MDKFGEMVEKWKIVGILEVESATEHQWLWPLTFTVDDLVHPLRIIVQMYHAPGWWRCKFVGKRVRVTGWEQDYIAVLNPYWLILSIDLQEGPTKAKDMEHAVLAGCKIIAPGRRKLLAQRQPSFQFKSIEHISQDVHIRIQSGRSDIYSEHHIIACPGEKV